LFTVQNNISHKSMHTIDNESYKLTLPHRIPRDRSPDDLHLLRDLVVGEAVLERAPHVHDPPRLAVAAGGLCLLRVEDDDGGDLLAPLFGGEADDGCFSDLWPSTEV